jgi:hypothetical protein
MAARGRTVNPDLVTDVDKWLRFYKANNRNIVYRDGAMLVLDPADIEADPIKTIAGNKSRDYLTLLSSEDRDDAIAKRDAVELEIAEAVLAARRTMLDVEQELLSAMDVWRSAETVAARQVATAEVGRLTRTMDNAEMLYRNAMYPHRFTKKEIVSNKLMDWATRDDRTQSVSMLVNMRTMPKDRAVIEADTA